MFADVLSKKTQMYLFIVQKFTDIIFALLHFDKTMI